MVFHRRVNVLNPVPVMREQRQSPDHVDAIVKKEQRGHAVVAHKAPSQAIPPGNPAVVSLSPSYPHLHHALTDRRPAVNLPDAGIANAIADLRVALLTASNLSGNSFRRHL